MEILGAQDCAAVLRVHNPVNGFAVLLVYIQKVGHLFSSLNINTRQIIGGVRQKEKHTVFRVLYLIKKFTDYADNMTGLNTKFFIRHNFIFL